MTEISIAKQQPRFFYGYALAGYSFAMGFLASSFFLHSRGIFFPVWMQEFAVDRTEISLVVSLVLFTSSCAAPFVGYLIDKFPLKIIICTGASWMALGYFSLQFVDGYTQFFIDLRSVSRTGLGMRGSPDTNQTHGELVCQEQGAGAGYRDYGNFCCRRSHANPGSLVV